MVGYPGVKDSQRVQQTHRRDHRAPGPEDDQPRLQAALGILILLANTHYFDFFVCFAHSRNASMRIDCQAVLTNPDGEQSYAQGSGIADMASNCQGMFLFP